MHTDGSSTSALPAGRATTPVLEPQLSVPRVDAGDEDVAWGEQAFLGRWLYLLLITWLDMSRVDTEAKSDEALAHLRAAATPEAKERWLAQARAARMAGLMKFTHFSAACHDTRDKLLKELSNMVRACVRASSSPH